MVIWCFHNASVAPAKGIKTIIITLDIVITSRVNTKKILVSTSAAIGSAPAALMYGTDNVFGELA